MWRSIVITQRFFFIHSPVLYTFFLVLSKNILLLDSLWLAAQKKKEKLKTKTKTNNRKKY